VRVEQLADAGSLRVISMTTLKTIELHCPVCKGSFSSRIVTSTDSLGGKHTDFHQRSAGLQPLPFLVHVCQRCGFAGHADQFAEGSTVDSMLERRVWTELAPRLSDRPLTGSEKYEFAARVAEWQDEGPREIGELWLRAAWCCVNEGDVEAERYYRRNAAWKFEEALARYDEVPRVDRPAYTYLVGELWRRIGDDARAREWFDKVAHEITRPAKQQWALDVSKQQREAPTEWFNFT
jgi:uncharacterized protein (DUF2225 family)